MSGMQQMTTLSDKPRAMQPNVLATFLACWCAEVMVRDTRREDAWDCRSVHTPLRVVEGPECRPEGVRHVFLPLTCASCHLLHLLHEAWARFFLQLCVFLLLLRCRRKKAFQAIQKQI